MKREREFERDRYTKRQPYQEDGWTSVTRRRSTQRQPANQTDPDRNTYLNRRKEREEAADRSIFVDNLPMIYESLLLKKLFMRIGNIIDSYVPGRTRIKLGTRYGFVCFGKEEEANLAIKKMDGVTLFGHKISVMRRKGGKLAPFSRNRATMAKVHAVRPQESSKPVMGTKTYAEAVKTFKSVWVEKKKENCDQDGGENRTTEESMGEVWAKVFLAKEWSSMVEEQQTLKNLVATLEERCRKLEKDMAVWKGCGNNINEEVEKSEKRDERDGEDESSNNLFEMVREDGINSISDEKSVIPETTWEDSKSSEGGEGLEDEDEVRVEEEEGYKAKAVFGNPRTKLTGSDPFVKKNGGKTIKPVSLKHYHLRTMQRNVTMKKKKKILGPCTGIIMKEIGELNRSVYHDHVDETSTSDTVSMEIEVGMEGYRKEKSIEEKIRKELVEANLTIEVGKKVGVIFNSNINSAIEKLVEMDKRGEALVK